MIEVRTQVPRVYYSESRDFQLIGRLFESIINYNKTNIDCMEGIKDVNDTPDSLVNLLAKTVGFESKHEYDIHDLKIICGCFSSILKYKGTRVAIDKAISALLNSQGIDEDYYVEYPPDTDEINQINIYLPSNVSDIILLKDLFNYILPVGWSYSLLKGIGGDKTTFLSEAKVKDEFSMEKKDTDVLDKVSKLVDTDESGDSSYETVTSIGMVTP